MSSRQRSWRPSTTLSSASATPAPERAGGRWIMRLGNSGRSGLGVAGWGDGRGWRF